MVEPAYGLKWRTIDLHMHTPASQDDYKNLAVEPSDIIQKTQELHLDAICISDHNTGSWIDPIKEAAQGTGIVVFPGVEITASGGERNVHILAILDPSKGTAHVNDLLAKLDVTEEKRGRTDVLARGDVNQVIDVIAEVGGIPILAHADSQSGVIEEMRGVARIETIQNPKLLGAQIVRDSTARFLNGTDPVYRRKLATFKASDAHSVEEIGRQVTYFKMGAMTISALRQCLYDPDTRIRYTQIVPMEYPKILSMEISQGFLGSQFPQFHHGLNSIIGGKGVGKSLIIEFLRFVLGQPSPVAAIKQDMNGKLHDQLGIGGEITIRVQTQAGLEFQITRQYDGLDNPLKIHNITEDSPYEGDVCRLFPILAYSQNEIIDISRDPSAQLELIDNLIDIDSYNSAIEELKHKLRNNKNQYFDSLTAREQVSQLTGEIDTLEQQIRELDSVLSDQIFLSKKKWDRQTSLLDSLFNKAYSLASEAQDFVYSHRDIALPTLSSDDQAIADLLSSYSAIERAANDFINRLRGLLDTYRTEIDKASEHREHFTKMFAEWEQQYEQFVAIVGGEKRALARRRTQRQNKLDELKELREQQLAKANLFQAVEEKRQQLLNALDQELDSRYQARAEVYRALTDMSRGKLRLTIQPNANRSSYYTALTGLSYGTRIRSQSLAYLSDDMTPRQLVDCIINKRISDLVVPGRLTSESADKLVGTILSDEIKTRDLLALPFEHISKDVPKIEFQKEDGNYYPLSQLSVGQKCTALLLIALSEGTMPIIVDQPEDALDVATIYSDVVSQLRERKESRQFILTTHNPNIAVTSDSDKYHVLRSTESSGQVVCCGAIDLQDVKEAVINQLEGGIDPYTLRGKKYELA